MRGGIHHLDLTVQEPQASFALYDAFLRFPGFTHQLRRLLIDDRAGCFRLGATGDERHDRGFGGMLHGA
jgi:hypothetical protein